MSSRVWYYRQDGQECGPFTAAELRTFAAQGVVTIEAQVRRGEAEAWVPACRVRGLLPERGAARAERRESAESSDAGRDGELGGRGVGSATGGGVGVIGTAAEQVGTGTTLRRSGVGIAVVLGGMLLLGALYTVVHRTGTGSGGTALASGSEASDSGAVEPPRESGVVDLAAGTDRLMVQGPGPVPFFESEPGWVYTRTDAPALIAARADEVEAAVVPEVAAVEPPQDPTPAVEVMQAAEATEKPVMAAAAAPAAVNAGAKVQAQAKPQPGRSVAAARPRSLGPVRSSPSASYRNRINALQARRLEILAAQRRAQAQRQAAAAKGKPPTRPELTPEERERALDTAGMLGTLFGSMLSNSNGSAGGSDDSSQRESDEHLEFLIQQQRSEHERSLGIPTP